MLVALRPVLVAKEEAKIKQAIRKAAASAAKMNNDEAFHRVVQFELFPAHSKSVEGIYSLTWLAKGEWREVIRSLGYTATTVWDSAGVAEESKPQYTPYPVWLMISAFSGQALRLTPKDRFGPVVRQKVNGKTEMCSEVKRQPLGSLKFCISPRTLALASAAYSYGDERVKYTGFVAWNGAMMPRGISARLGRTLILRAKVTALSRYAGSPDAVLNVPTGPNVYLSPICKHVVPPKALFAPPPAYPLMAEENLRTGTVRAWAIIGRDGLLHHITVIQSASPALDAAAIRVLRRWRFRPATCSGYAEPAAQEEHVTFTLGP